MFVLGTDCPALHIPYIKIWLLILSGPFHSVQHLPVWSICWVFFFKRSKISGESKFAIDEWFILFPLSNKVCSVDTVCVRVRHGGNW